MSTDKRLSVLGHLSELRSRLIKCAVAVVITTGAAFVYADWLFKILLRPANGINLIYIDVTEMLGTYMKVCLAAGIAVAMPFLVFQVIMFVTPALSRHEKRYVFLVIPWVFLMFAAGVVFSYFVLIPPAMNFLLTFGEGIATPQIRIENYISLVTRLLLACGIVFELPVISTFLARIGIVTSSWLAGKRKIAVVMAFVLGAMITPTFDPINQSLVALPLIVLYEMSIWLARIAQKKRSPVVVVPTPAT